MLQRSTANADGQERIEISGRAEPAAPHGERQQQGMGSPVRRRRT